MTALFKLLCRALPCLLLVSCAASRAPSGAAASGAVVRAAFARQVIGMPSAAPVTGIDGAAALQAQKKYSKSFAEPEPAARPLVIGVGAHK